jgi:5-methylcytosine-specific restriction endonuclease McrA
MSRWKLTTQCSRCTKPFCSELPKVANCGWCRPCCREYSREHYLKNREHKLAQNAGWKKANPERYKALTAAHFVKNRVTRIAQMQDYRKTAEGRTTMKAANANSRAKRWGCPGELSAEDVRLVYAECAGRCSICADTLIRWEIDHIVPLSKGGSNTRQNIQITCCRCNRSKGTKCS